MTGVANLEKKTGKTDTSFPLISGNLYETIDFHAVQRLCKKTQTYKLMTGLIGDTGLGKSTALNAYRVTHKNVFKVVVDKTMNAKRLYLHILETLEVKFDGNIHDVMLKIAETLNSMDSPLLIVDEAGKMNHVMMLYMHDLREYTKGKCGIVLSGMPYFRSNLQKFADKGKEGCSEFHRRINLWHVLGGLSRAEIKYICSEEGICDDSRIKDLYRFKRFGDLMNELMLDNIISGEEHHGKV